MFERFNQCKKWGDYFNYKQTEVRVALVLTAAIVAYFNYLNIYDSFSNYSNMLSNLLLYIFAGILGLLGFSLSGIAVISSLFNQDQIKLIEEYNGKGIIDDILVSYEFMAFNLAIGAIWHLMLYFAIYSERVLIAECFFWLIVSITIYYIIFVLFYVVGLTGNCVRLYRVRNTYDKIEWKKKSLYDSANEVRIDYLLLIISQITKIPFLTLIEEIKNIVNESELEDKDQIITYFKNIYDKDKK